MIKAKIKTSMSSGLLAILLVVLVSGSRSNSTDPFLDYVAGRLQQYNKGYHTERVYIMTDRFVYRPGEDLWFKGFVLASGAQHMVASEDLFVKLLNNKGDEIISRRYPINMNQATGRLLIPRNTIPGRYWLVGFSGWMKNQCSREVFKKEILISKYFDKRFRVEMSTDKTYYYPGDTLNAHITLKDAAGKPLPGVSFDYMVASFGNQFDKGSGETDVSGSSELSFAIPASGELVFLEIEVRSRKVSGDYTLLIPALTAAPEVSFFSEGGRPVRGIPCTMALRATDAFGQPAVITGDIIDFNGHRLQSVQTNDRGTGLFEYLPQSDTCFLSITTPAGLPQKYPLPLPNDSGLVIHLEKQQPDTVWFTITSSGEHSGITTYWLATRSNRIMWSREVRFSGSGLVGIPVSSLGSGLFQISVFDQSHNLAAERLLQITDSPVQIKVKTDRKQYHARQRVNLSLEADGAGKTINLTMLVALDHLARNPLMEDFRDVAGNFFCDTAYLPYIRSGLVTDADVLATSFRPLKWDDVLTENQSEPVYRKQDGITGRVYDKKNNLSQHAKVRVTHVPNYKSYETKTDETGLFHVGFGSDIIDLNYLDVEAYDALGKVSLIANVDHDYSDALREMLAIIGESNDRMKVGDIISYGEPDLVFALRYGPGKFRSVPDTRKKYDPVQYAGYASTLDIIQDIKPYRLSNNSIVFLASEEETSPGINYKEGAIIVINGALKGNRIDILKNLPPSDITNINISTSLLDVHKYTSLNFQGVIEITTIQGMFKYRQPTVQLGMDILNTNREFYMPDYSVESSSSTDNRKTLYWNPYFEMKSGQPALITFYTSDIEGIYYGLAEGTDEEGNPVRAEFSFIVE